MREATGLGTAKLSLPRRYRKAGVMQRYLALASQWAAEGREEDAEHLRAALAGKTTEEAPGVEQ